MAEDENTQDQGQPESQPPGGGGFISLDQARAAALAHARDNQDFYGRRYRKEGAGLGGAQPGGAGGRPSPYL